MNQYLRMDAGKVIFDITALTNAFPELADDEQLRADVAEGETELASVMKRLLRAKQDADALAKGAREAAKETSERARRFEDRADKLKSMMLAVMDAGDFRKLELPFATFSAIDPKPVADVFNVSELPQGFTRTKVEAEKREILKALMAGEDVPGARLALGDASLMIRGA